MGIPGFTLWFQEENGRCYAPLNTFPVDHLYIDANSVLHTAIRNATCWEHFHKLLHVRLNRILEVTGPRKSVMIAVDGPAPLAKLLTQRERRKNTKRDSKGLRKKKWKSSRQKLESKQGDVSSSSGEEDVEVLTGNSITPGTRFMLDLTLSLLSWACSRLSSAKYGHLKIEVSDATVKGEGEVKILGRIARPIPGVLEEDMHAIVGDDADLVLMAMVCQQHRLLVINGALNDGEMSPSMPVFSVPRLHAEWSKTILKADAARSLNKSEDAMLMTLKCDLALITVISKGNDYVPPLKGVNLDTMWDEYKKMWRRRPLREGGPGIVAVDASGLPKLCVIALATLLAACSRPDLGHHSKYVEEEIQYKRPSNSAAYLQGLVWLMHMYLQGECPDYRYYYDGHAPHASEVIATCKEKAGIKVIPKGADSMLYDPYYLEYTSAYYPLSPGAHEPLLPYVSAMALLPARSRQLLPSAVHEIMMDQSSPIADIYHECETCKVLSEGVSASNREYGLLKMKYDAIESFLTEALKQGDEDHVQELKIKLDAAFADVEAGKILNRKADEVRRAHLNASHKYEPFPVESLVLAASAIPKNAFLPAEQPVTTFGRSSVFMRSSSRANHNAGTHSPQWKQGGGQGRSYSSTNSAHQRRQQLPSSSFKPPPAPFTNSKQASWPQRPVPLERYAIQEPELCGMSAGEAAEVVCVPVTLIPELRPVIPTYLSCPVSEQTLFPSTDFANKDATMASLINVSPPAVSSEGNGGRKFGPGTGRAVNNGVYQPRDVQDNGEGGRGDRAFERGDSRVGGWGTGRQAGGPGSSNKHGRKAGSDGRWRGGEAGTQGVTQCNSVVSSAVLRPSAAAEAITVPMPSHRLLSAAVSSAQTSVDRRQQTGPGAVSKMNPVSPSHATYGRYMRQDHQSSWRGTGSSNAVQQHLQQPLPARIQDPAPSRQIRPVIAGSCPPHGLSQAPGSRSMPHHIHFV